MRRKIIKTLSLLVVLVLLLTLCACESGSGSSTDKGDSKDDHPEMNIGVLTMLNLSEEETEDLVTAIIV